MTIDVVYSRCVGYGVHAGNHVLGARAVQRVLSSPSSPWGDTRRDIHQVAEVAALSASVISALGGDVRRRASLFRCC